MKQYRNRRWGVTITNRSTGKIKEIARSVDNDEAVLLCHYLVSLTETENNDPKTIINFMRDIIKTNRTCDTNGLIEKKEVK